MKKKAVTSRRVVVGVEPTVLAGPIRWGASAGTREVAQLYSPNRLTRTAVSIRPSSPLNGMNSAYTVASSRTDNSSAWLRSSFSRRRAMAEPGQQHDRAPAESDQQSVGAGHVGDRVAALGYFRVAAGLVGEDRVDGVFRQDGDQREQRQGQRLRDVHLEHLRGPRQQKGRAEDGHARSAPRWSGDRVHRPQVQRDPRAR